MLAVIDPWTGSIWFTVLALIAGALFWGAWRVLRGRQRWLMLLPSLVGVIVLGVVFDALVLAPIRWQRDGVCSSFWQAVPTYLDDGSYNRTPELRVAP